MNAFWLIPAALAAVAAAWWIGVRRRARSQRDVTWVGNAAYVTGLPGYRRAIVRRRFWLAAAVAGLALFAAGAGGVVARPAAVYERSDGSGTRDIVLCLDVSGSGRPYVRQIAREFGELVGELGGERVGLSVFNATSLTVFPLTDDYGAVADELDRLSLLTPTDQTLFMTREQQELEDEIVWPTMGNWELGSSLVGDGLASCTALFDGSPTERSRTVVLATDNWVNGEPVFTLEAATDLVAQAGAVLEGLYTTPNPADMGPELDPAAQREEFERCAARTGGAVYIAADPTAVPAFIARIKDQRLVDHAQTVTERADRPARAVLATALGLGCFLLGAWRARA